jgi:hypothetical protein
MLAPLPPGARPPVAGTGFPAGPATAH